MENNKVTFYDWCVENNRQDILDRWNYELTGFDAKDVTCDTDKYVYLKNKKNEEFKRRKIQTLIETNGKHSHNFIDITGQTFGELTAIKVDEERVRKLGAKNKSTPWICKCSCGKYKTVMSSHLRRGLIKTCGDASIHWSGENAPAWKGGLTCKRQLNRTNSAYEKWRSQVYAKDWYTCQCCGAYGSNVEKNAHHFIPFVDSEELMYDVDNGICLCAECHHIKHKGSFHNLYGVNHTTPEQLEEYINNRRKQLGIDIPFTIEDYKSRKNILLPPSKRKELNKLNTYEYAPIEGEELWQDENTYSYWDITTTRSTIKPPISYPKMLPVSIVNLRK